MRIGVTYDLRADYLAMGMSEEDTAEFDSEITIAAICSALGDLGLTPVRIGTVKNLIAKLAKGERFDAVFNFCEGLKGIAREAQVPAILDIYDIPYVFSDPLTLALALDKGMCKRVVRDAGVPTVDFRVIEKLSDVKKVDLPFPLFLKPMREGSGKGVGADSKVENARDLRRVAGTLLAKFNQPVLVEEFLPGREFTVGIVGTGDDAAVWACRRLCPLETGSVTATAMRTRNIPTTRSPSSKPTKRTPKPPARWHWPHGVRCVAVTAVASMYAATPTASRISSRSIRSPACGQTIRTFV